MQSDLNKFFPRKRKWSLKSKGGLKSSSPRKADLPAQQYRVDHITLFATRPMMVQDLFVKSILLKATASPSTVKVLRAYKEKAGSVRTEASNITCAVMAAEQMLHLRDLFMTEEFGLRVEMSEGSFVVNAFESPTDLIRLEDSDNRTIHCEVRATPVKVG